MATKIKTLFIALFAVALSLTARPVEAHSQPASITIVGDGIGDGAWQISVPIPAGKTVNVRLIGKDRSGKAVKLDPKRIVWKMSHKDFSMKVVNGVAQVTAHADSFGRLDATPKSCPKPDSCKEPTTWLTANYGSITAGVQVLGAMNVLGKWVIHSGKDRITVNIIRQSGRWIVDSAGKRGELRGTRMDLHLWADIRVFGNTELWPVVHFTSRTAGGGTVYVNALVGTEKFTIIKQP